MPQTIINYYELKRRRQRSAIIDRLDRALEYLAPWIIIAAVIAGGIIDHQTYAN